jgi:thiol-disulfide isomerase/thioredoxin
MRPRPRLALALALVALVSGCGGAETPAAEPASVSTTPDGADASDPGPSPEPDPDRTREPVPETLDFTATTVGGDPFEGASLAGRPALLWFWAPWCPTCRSQIPQVQDIAGRYGEDVAVIGIGSLDSADAIAEFADEVGGVTHLEDVDGALYRKFGIAEQSSFVLLDAEGGVAFETGYGGSEDLADEVADVVG